MDKGDEVLGIIFEGAGLEARDMMDLSDFFRGRYLDFSASSGFGIGVCDDSTKMGMLDKRLECWDGIIGRAHEQSIEFHNLRSDQSKGLWILEFN